MNRKQMKNEKGVTLVALAVTVIVALILTSIIVADAVNEDAGIIVKTEEVQEDKDELANNIVEIQKEIIDDIKNKR